MRIRPVSPEDRGQWMRLRLALWPDSGPDAPHEMDDYFRTGGFGGLAAMILVLEREGSQPSLGGFAEVSLRPIASGCRTSPVGYLEGWYVDPDLRRRGWGRRLVEAAEAWAIQQGCRHFASDRDLQNHVSDAAHRALGFSAANAGVCLIKPIGLPTDSAYSSTAVGLLPVPLDSGAAVEFVTDPAAGGIALFAGTTRCETGADGRSLLALDYEAYPEMAQRQLQDLAETARRRWPAVRLVLLHRTGRVGLGEPSVLIAVSTPHRGEAFECCRWLIDTLKAELAVWKKEVWASGQATWAPPNREWRGRG